LSLLDSQREEIRKEANDVQRGRLAIESEVQKRVGDIVGKLKKG
jgi:hypothetical protein